MALCGSGGEPDELGPQYMTKAMCVCNTMASPGTSGPGCASSDVRVGAWPASPANAREKGRVGHAALPTQAALHPLVWEPGHLCL